MANGSKKAVYNTIDSGSDINLNAKSALSLKGANLNSGSDINLNAELIAISNTNDESYHKEEHKSSRVGILKPNEVLKDIVVDLKRKLNPLKEAKDKFSSLSTPTFVIGKTSTKFESNNQEAKSSNIKAGKNININANKDINIVASNVDAKENLNLKANEAVEISSANSISNAKSESVSRKILGKQSASASSTNEEVVSSNLNAKNINIASNQDTTLSGSNISADESLDIKADNINLLPASYSLESSSKFKDSGFGDLMKSNGEESNSNYNLAISTLSAKDISLNSNTINALASVIEATNVDVNTELLNLVSAKSTSVNTTLSNNAGVLTATVKNKGKIEEVEIPAIIKVKDKFTLNGKDITNKLDATTFKAINDSLNSEEFKEGVIRELRSNSDTPIDEETINQVKAVLNSKEWENKTTTLSGMGALIITAIVTFLTAGAGGAVAAGVLGSAAAASSTAGLAISAMTTAVIANSTVQLTNNLLSHGKVKFDASSLAKSAISAGVLSYAGAALGTNALTQNMDFSDYVKNATINGTLQGISSEINGGEFKKGFLMGVALSIMSDASLQMRKHVKENYNYAGKNGEIVPDDTQSVGVRGDGVKIGGSHFEKVYEDGVLKGRPIDAPTGGSQTGPRRLFGKSYEKGSLADHAIEHFAGPHDFMSSWNYENINGVTYLKDNGSLVNIASGLLLVPAAPFAAAPFIQGHLSDIQIYKDVKKVSKDARREVLNKAKENR